MILWALLFGWFGRFAYTRLTTGVIHPNIEPEYLPVAEYALSEPDRTNELISALNLMPPRIKPRSLPPAPAGKRWEDEFSNNDEIEEGIALEGDWTPERRPHLQQVIEFLEASSTQKLLSALRSVPTGRWRPPRRQDPPSIRALLDRAAEILLVRARFYFEEGGDPDAGFRDIKVVYALAGICLDSGTWIDSYMGLSLASRANMGLLRLAMEYDFSSAQARDMIDFLIQFEPSIPETWNKIVMSEEAAIPFSIGNFFSGGEEGWLLLSEIGWGWQWGTLERDHRSRLWNLSGPFFNSREVVKRKHMAILQQVRFAEMGGDRQWCGRKVLSQQACLKLGVLDAGMVYGGDFTSVLESRHSRLVGCVAAFRAARTVLAMSAYHGEHDRYPRSLEELVPRYLPEVPEDPFSDEALIYRPDLAIPAGFYREELFPHRQLKDDSPALYSVGPNLEDDRCESKRNAYSAYDEDRGDLIFTWPRPEASDPILVEIKNGRAGR